jgi:hypothetical protein
MKKINFNWFKSLFNKKEPQHKPFVPASRVIEPIRYNQRVIPKHNNRKSTRGRRIQYIDMGGYERPIYHSPQE